MKFINWLILAYKGFFIAIINQKQETQTNTVTNNGNGPKILQLKHDYFIHVRIQSQAQTLSKVDRSCEQET